MELLLNFWREACRHIELSESIARLTELVRRKIPVELVLVRRFSARNAVVETVAVGQHGGVPIPRQARTECTQDDVDRITEWSREGNVLRSENRERFPVLKTIIPADLRGSVMAGPLVTSNGKIGILLFVGNHAEFADEHEAVMKSLLEPFTVALENHQRFKEIARLQKAAEAEKQALLSRLRRQEIVEEIVGDNGTLRGVMEQVEQVAPTNAPVLILGETGTGKEVIARAIHARSARRDGPVVRVNCGAIAPELIDSELFGHEKGSFTGAVNEHPGWFERADGGTLFLDEIGELSLAAQVRLLRVLQDGSYERVGGKQTRTADVRLIAATHRDMDRLVADGLFREDLWYRISVFPIYLPPLRARFDDLPELVRHFARNAGLRLGGIPLEPTQEDMNMLRAYPWPGNVRELSAVIERAAILGGGQRLDIAGAMGTKLHALAERTGEPSDTSSGETFSRSDATPIDTLDNVMAEHIKRALAHTKGRIEGPFGAAQLLGINPNTLRGRMRRLGIDWRSMRDE